VISELEANKLLSSGGDERIKLDKDGLNTQHLSPISPFPQLNRGTCTCSVIAKERIPEVDFYYNEYKKIGYQAYRDSVENKLVETLDLDRDYDVYFAPSGTDLCYYPMLFSHLLQDKSKKLFNIATNIDELGRGVKLAYSGYLYFEENQIIDKYGPIKENNYAETINTKFLKARENDGETKETAKLLFDTITKNQNDYNVVLNLNVCSKSGIVDDLNIIEELKDVPNLYIIVDCCQFRNSRLLIQKLLDLNCMVMITGSKFFSAPPFSAALIAPKHFGNDILKLGSEIKIPELFTKIFLQSDFPNHLTNLKSQFHDMENVGFFTRWKIALEDMSQFFKVEEKGNEIIGLWNSHVTNYIQSLPEYFEIMPKCERNFKSIISFKVKSANSTEFLDYEELKKIRKHLLTNVYEREGGKTKLIIGQPVKYEGGAFLRVALGARNILNYLIGDLPFEEDEFIIDKIKELVE
jgi:hypothetical protein